MVPFRHVILSVPHFSPEFLLSYVFCDFAMFTLFSYVFLRAPDPFVSNCRNQCRPLKVSWTLFKASLGILWSTPRALYPTIHCVATMAALGER